MNGNLNTYRKKKMNDNERDKHMKTQEIDHQSNKSLPLHN